MSDFDNVPAILLLEDGTVFHGRSCGKIGTTTGEICFNTGMTGYQEVFTDPSYFGQLLVMTNAHIGNYGTHPDEIESDSVKISGLVTKKFTNLFSRERAEDPIQDYLIDNGIIGISDVDTRALVRHIRDKGAMNAVISSEVLDTDALHKLLQKTPSMEGLELASKVSTKKPYFFGNSDGHYKVAILDLGVKRNILRCFAQRGCYLQVFPAKTTFAEMQEWAPDGYFISNGPGDPASMPYAVEAVKDILNSEIPIFGICLGHQILAIANGATTYKLHHGHRGLNHPVLRLDTKKCEVTSQNHGFGVDVELVNKDDRIKVTHVNLNDQTIEGIKIIDKDAFSVQYHPEAAAGPHDSRYLFDAFIEMIRSRSKESTVKATKLSKVIS